MRDVVQVLVAAVAVLVLGVAAWLWLFAADPLDPVVVQQVRGEVTRVRGGVEAPATLGEALRDDDQIRVNDGAAVLSMGQDTRLTLHEGASLRLLGLAEDGLRVELENGRVEATVRPGTPSLRVSSRGRGVVAQDADFALAVDDEGTFDLEARRGDLGVFGVDGVERLGEGQRLYAAPGQSATVAEIPSTLLLDVPWPEGGPTKETSITVRGVSAPGAKVVGPGGVSARAGPDGAFTLTLALAEGQNELTLEATDLHGRRSTAVGRVVRDTTGPTAEFRLR